MVEWKLDKAKAQTNGTHNKQHSYKRRREGISFLTRSIQHKHKRVPNTRMEWSFNTTSRRKEWINLLPLFVCVCVCFISWILVIQHIDDKYQLLITYYTVHEKQKTFCLFLHFNCYSNVKWATLCRCINQQLPSIYFQKSRKFHFLKCLLLHFLLSWVLTVYLFDIELLILSEQKKTFVGGVDFHWSAF